MSDVVLLRSLRSGSSTAATFPNFPVARPAVSVSRPPLYETLTRRNNIDCRNNLPLLAGREQWRAIYRASLPLRSVRARHGCPRTEYRVVTSARLMISLP